jgi:alkanesulfonate monooxygenase SsuD/methylene tetrahydromethanopterin reductase-like flavin-dependent oxidoreductase (luciferase family)
MTKFGLLLPHFGQHASAELLKIGSQKAEDLGFDSLWVRDHIVFHPHGIEGDNRTFIDPIATLAWVAAATSRIELGTATLIPHRHPIHLAQVVASLAWLSGRPFHLGVGAGNAQHEFDAIGLGGEARPDLMQEQIGLIRRIWAESEVSYRSERYQFDGVGLLPAPGYIPIWWGGGTPASTRLAVDYCDGWLPGRITFDTYALRVRSIQERAMQNERAMILLGAVPMVSIGESREDATRTVDVAALLQNANRQRFWIRPTGGSFTTLEELDGSILFGSPSDVIKGIHRYMEIGCDLLVLDLRLRFADWLDQVELIAREVLPRVKPL